MRNVVAIVTVLMFAFSVAFARGQQQQQGGATGGAGEQMEQQGGMTGGASDQLGQMGQEKTVTAIIKDVNAFEKSLALTNEQGQTSQFTLSDDTKIMTAAGEQKKIRDLKAGDRVTVTYTEAKVGNPKVTQVQIQ